MWLGALEAHQAGNRTRTANTTHARPARCRPQSGSARRTAIELEKPPVGRRGRWIQASKALIRLLSALSFRLSTPRNTRASSPLGTEGLAVTALPTMPSTPFEPSGNSRRPRNIGHQRKRTSCTEGCPAGWTPHFRHSTAESGTGSKAVKEDCRRFSTLAYATSPIT